MQSTKITNRQILPHVEDKYGYLYIEKARVEQDGSSLCVIQGDEITPIPVCSLVCMILGPGTTITHRAVSMIADSDCLLVWAGENMRTYYNSDFYHTLM